MTEQKPARLYREMTWPEIAEAARTDIPVAIPIGSTEQHGHHLPVCTDWLIPEKLLELGNRDELDQRAGLENHAGTAEHDEEDRIGAEERGVDRPDLVIAHGEDRDDHHVDGVPHAPSSHYVASHGDAADR